MNIKAVDIVRSIDHNGLDESEAEILRKAVQKIKALRRKDFDRALKQASEIVASWPTWKRELADQVLRSTREAIGAIRKQNGL